MDAGPRDGGRDAAADADVTQTNMVEGGSGGVGGQRSGGAGGAGGEGGAGGKGGARSDGGAGEGNGAPSGRGGGDAPRDPDAGGAGAGGMGAAGSAGAAGQTGMGDEVPAGSILWFRADEGVVLDAEGKVATWSDRSGQTRDAHPPSPARAPKTTMLDSRVWLEFAGAQELEIPKVPAIPQLSVFVAAVARDDGAPRCPSLLHLSNLNNSPTVQSNHVEVGRHKDKLYYQVVTSYVYADDAHGQSFDVAEPHVVGIVHAEDRVARLRVDGIVVAETEMPLPGAVERDHNIIGNNRFYVDSDTTECDPFVGLIGEIVVYPRALNADEVSAVEEYLSTKWGVAR